MTNVKKPPVAVRVVDDHGLVTVARVGPEGPYLQVSRRLRGSGETLDDPNVHIRSFVPLDQIGDDHVTYCSKGRHDIAVPQGLRNAVARFQAGGPPTKLKV